MFEIDNVRGAIGGSQSYGTSFTVADELATAYLEVIEMATRPCLKGGDINRFHDQRRIIDGHLDIILPALEMQQPLSDLLGSKGSLKEAFLNTLTQCDEIIAT